MVPKSVSSIKSRAHMLPQLTTTTENAVARRDIIVIAVETIPFEIPLVCCQAKRDRDCTSIWKKEQQEGRYEGHTLTI